MILSPLPTTLGSWSDADSDGHNDTWTDPNTSQVTTLADLNLQNNDADNDGATNDEEAVEGSNPFNLDTDYDGISDGDELHIVKPLIGTSLTDWDSDGDEVSDYDEWYNHGGVTYPGGQLPNFPGAGYSDYDGDGFKNPIDPFPTDPDNYSILNSISWYGGVLGDDDSDGTLNWEDGYPYDAGNGILDTDGDGLTDSDDPFPNDNTNYSATNNIAWYGEVRGDADSDGTLNWQDPTPYPPIDDDSDGIDNSSDPYPNDNTNYSSYNSIAWYVDVLGDADSDGTANYLDPSPYPPADSDADSIADAADPFPNDANNYSPINGIAWYGDVFGDADSDGTLNWEDPTPTPPVPPDTDGDSIPDASDPYPTDNANHSNINNITWYADVNGDNDGDGILNWTDPYPTDNTNFCALNNIAWYGDVLNDDDTDGYPNWQDSNPSPYIDQDGDGIPNGQDPYYQDNTNYSSTNGITWYQDVLGDADSDGRPNYEDMWPYDPLNDPDRDGDGLRTSQETTYGTSDFDVDRDDDGLTDYEEVIIYNTNPLNAHDLSEERGWGDLYTDYQLVDTTDSDGDTIPNRIEIFYGMLPNNAEDGFGDLDANGISNATQYSAGLALNVDLNRYDADSDGMTDIFEDYYGLNKNSAADAMGDADNDGALNFEEASMLSSPLNANSRELGIYNDLYFLACALLYPESILPEWQDNNNNDLPDWYDDALVDANPRFIRQAPNDLDGDGMPDVWEHQYGRWKYPTMGLYVRHDDASNDPDDDGVPNLVEYRLATNPLIVDSNQDGVDDGDEDFDSDGLSNGTELVLGTNPLLADSDGDGYSDYEEQQAGADPLDGLSTPTDPGGGAGGSGGSEGSEGQVPLPEVSMQTRTRTLDWTFWTATPDSDPQDGVDDSSLGGGTYSISNARGITKYLASWNEYWENQLPEGQGAADLVASASVEGSMMVNNSPTLPPFNPLNSWTTVGSAGYGAAPYWPYDLAPPEGWIATNINAKPSAFVDETVVGIHTESNDVKSPRPTPRIHYSQTRLTVGGVHPHGYECRYLVVKEQKWGGGPAEDGTLPELSSETKVLGVATLRIAANDLLGHATFTPVNGGAGSEVRVTTFADGSEGLTIEPAVDADKSIYYRKGAWITLEPIYLAADVDRNGTIDFDKDVTTSGKPLRFWLNDDSDVEENPEGDSSLPDYTDEVIKTTRDLEDFMMLRFRLPPIIEAKILSGEVEIGLEWAPDNQGAPSIKVHQAYWQQTVLISPYQYLWNRDVARAYVNSPYQHPALMTVPSMQSTIPYRGIVPVNLNYLHPYLLFEGVNAGSGRLVLTLKIDGTTIVGPGIWLKLVDVKQMYQRGESSLAVGAIAQPNTGTVRIPAINIGPGHQGEPFTPDPDEKPESITMVHGWNMTYGAYNTYSQTMFKRLWWKGYRGRFCSFRWPTYAGGLMDHYNLSEFVAWKHGRALKAFISSLPKSYSKNIYAHSMGNIVASSALEKGMVVRNYVLTQAAIPAGCFDSSSQVNSYARFLNEELGNPTPDLASSELGYRGRVGSANARLINFYNPVDYALVTGTYPVIGEVNWEKNQVAYKPNTSVGVNLGYDYKLSRPLGSRASIEFSSPELSVSRTIIDPHEMMAFVARPRSKAVGALAGVGGAISGGEVDLNQDLDPYPIGQTREDHGGQFERPIQEVEKYYNLLLDRLDVTYNEPLE